MRRAFHFALGVLLVGSAHVGALAIEGVGAFFDLGTSSRAQGMGGAVLALCPDESAVFYNPAGLAALDSCAVSSTHTAHFAGVTYGTVGITFPFFGFQVLLLDSGEIKSSDSSIRYAAQGVVMSAGIQLASELVMAGLRLRYMNVSSPQHASGWTVDPALLVASGGLRGAVMFEGAVSSCVEGTRMEKETWARAVRVGVAIESDVTSLVEWSLGAEMSDVFGGAPDVALGGELGFGGLLVRAGYNGDGVTIGLSVAIRDVRLDWAYIGRRDLGRSHRMGVTFDFPTWYRDKDVQ